MKRFILSALTMVCMLSIGAQEYVPTAENIASRKQFSDSKFGIFLHWGIYSMFGQGEWYLNNGKLKQEEYAKAADAFYPHRFNAEEWVSAFKDAGAKYICITSRHHDGFSMWGTKQSKYNIVDATPFHRDVLKELSAACQKYGIRLHFYYSHLDWGRDDYPLGNTGHDTGRDPQKANWPHYYQFMNNQLTELLTQYGPIGAIWFDGVWDHPDKNKFDWQLKEQYELIHRLQPACLVGNNHHTAIRPGEDIQIFERDLPGENKAGFSKGQEVGTLPLETCETMNGIWGYKANDQNYKTANDIIRLLVNASGKGANLLMNLGPQPNGQLPELGLKRLHEVGTWMKQYGETLYGTTRGYLLPQEWGAMTCKGNIQYVHILKQPGKTLELNFPKHVKKATLFIDGTPVKFSQKKELLILNLPEKIDVVDYVIALEMKK